ncbi:MAG: hypothetical protein IPM54_03380 [Polyangiaceae bacterium]|nr:hypothetical protein [Polyangiaceae bacterium]
MQRPASDDVDTTGNGGSTQPNAQVTEDAAPSPLARFVEGAGERGCQNRPEPGLGVLMNLVGAPASPAGRANQAAGRSTVQANGWLMQSMR